MDALIDPADDDRTGLLEPPSALPGCVGPGKPSRDIVGRVLWAKAIQGEGGEPRGVAVEIETAREVLRFSFGLRSAAVLAGIEVLLSGKLIPESRVVRDFEAGSGDG